MRALAAACLCGAAVLTGCGGGSPSSAPTRSGAAPPPAAPRPAPAAPHPAIGITEGNPGLVAPGRVPEQFPPMRDALAALHPAYLRIVVDWAKIQPDPARPADLALDQDGCMRGMAPCGPYAGLRAQLEAARERQEASGGAAVVIVLQGVPEWAAHAPRGCERPQAAARNRPITDAGLAAYSALIAGVLRLGREVGVALPWWAPWNEPNHPAFISPQRRHCDAGSPSLAPAVYARLVRAAQRVLGPAPGTQRLVLGDLAGVDGPTPKVTGVGEFVRALPDDVACAADAWAQHNYVQPGGEAPDAVGELERALAARPCTARAPVWVTETGAGGVRAGRERGTGERALERQCRAQAAALRRWARDPRLAAAFQYTFREDPAFPVGLADAALTRTYPTYGVWRALADGRQPGALSRECHSSRQAAVR